MTLSNLYKTSLSLLTDLYQLTMGYGYWKNGMATQQAVFHLFFRKPPFKGNYTVTAGLQYVIDLVQGFKFTQEDVDYLATLTGNNEQVLFEPAFLHYLKNLTLTCDIAAMPEGTVAFPHEPILKISGPLLQVQLLETALLNIINFQTLIATKAARVCEAARGEAVLEFGLRRAQGIDGGLSASRAAYIGGCAATSNVLAGRLFDIPVKGTHAHSWVMCFSDEITAFEQYAKAMPNNCIFLVDTYDTIEGVKKAIEVGKQLKVKGYKMAGIRLDSGDLADLSIKARQLLDEHGFTDAVIAASNDLEEYKIKALKEKGAKISVWGVGTNLVTAKDQPALGGVYKLGAIQDENGQWQHRIKLSENPIKISNPGSLQIYRYSNEAGMQADVFIDELNNIQVTDKQFVTFDNQTKDILDIWTSEKLLQPIFKNGQLVYQTPDIHSIRVYAKEQIKHFKHKQNYPTGLTKSLSNLKTKLIKQINNQTAKQSNT